MQQACKNRCRNCMIIWLVMLNNKRQESCSSIDNSWCFPQRCPSFKSPSPQLSNYQKILNSKQTLHDLLQHSTKYVENRSDTKLLLLCRYHCFWRRVSLTHSLVVIDHLWRYVLFPTWFTLVCVTHFYFLLTLFEKLSCKQVGPGFPPLNET